MLASRLKNAIASLIASPCVIQPARFARRRNRTLRPVQPARFHTEELFHRLPELRVEHRTTPAHCWWSTNAARLDRDRRWTLYEDQVIGRESEWPASQCLCRCRSCDVRDVPESRNADGFRRSSHWQRFRHDSKSTRDHTVAPLRAIGWSQ